MDKWDNRENRWDEEEHRKGGHSHGYSGDNNENDDGGKGWTPRHHDLPPSRAR